MSSRIVLALEFSTDRRSVVLARNGAVLAESVQDLGRSTRVFSLIAGTLAQAGIKPADVDVLALDIGPGSYTGIRLAISVAQGWSLASDGGRAVEIRVMSSFDLLAETILGPAWLAADAQRDEWAVARLESGRVVEDPRLIPSAELAALAGAGRVVGPEVVSRLGVGQTAHPDAVVLALLAETRGKLAAAEALEPVYLRAASFVKAPPPRNISGTTL